MVARAKPQRHDAVFYFERFEQQWQGAPDEWKASSGQVRTAPIPMFVSRRLSAVSREGLMMEDNPRDYPSSDEQVNLAKQYFRKVDAGDPSLLDMFADDAQAYFPRFGIARGKTEFISLVQGLNAAVSRFIHDENLMIFTQAGNRVVVEGIETGALTDGTPFPGDAGSGGHFCNVFEFRGSLISRLHIYADPNFTGKHPDLFKWGNATESG